MPRSGTRDRRSCWSAGVDRGGRSGARWRSGSIIGLAESSSEHPISKAVFANSKERLGLSNEASLEGSAGEFQAVVGKGIIASVEPATSMGRKRYQVLVGHAPFL